jgi:predicted HicB family RNase H-like nuclease
MPKKKIEKPARRAILVIVDVALHRALARIAKREGISVRALCRRALDREVQP